MAMSRMNAAWLLACSAGLCISAGALAQQQQQRDRNQDDTYSPGYGQRDQYSRQDPYDTTQGRMRQRPQYDQYGNRIGQQDQQFDAYGNRINRGQQQGRQSGLPPYGQRDFGTEQDTWPGRQSQYPGSGNSYGTRDWQQDDRWNQQSQNRSQSSQGGYDPYGTQRSSQMRSGQNQYGQSGQFGQENRSGQSQFGQSRSGMTQSGQQSQQYGQSQQGQAQPDRWSTQNRRDQWGNDQQEHWDMQRQDRFGPDRWDSQDQQSRRSSGTDDNWPGRQTEFPGQGNAYGARDGFSQDQGSQYDTSSRQSGSQQRYGQGSESGMNSQQQAQRRQQQQRQQQFGQRSQPQSGAEQSSQGQSTRQYGSGSQQRSGQQYGQGYQYGGSQAQSGQSGSNQSGSTQSSSTQYGSSQHMQSGSGQQLSGQVQNVTVRELQGERHILALVNTSSGPQWIDLGNEEDAQQIRTQITQGKQITFSASPTTISGQQVMVAQNVQIDGQTIQLGSSGQSFAGNDPSMSSQRTQTFQSSAGHMEGSIQTVQTTTIQGEQHLVVSLQTDQGVKQIDIGPANEVQHLRTRLVEGERLIVTARPGSGQTLVAQTLDLNGETIPLGGRSFEQRSYTETYATNETPQRQQVQTQTYSQSSGPMQIDGTIDTVLVRNLQGDRHLLTLIDGDSGFHWVDFGMLDDLQQFRDVIEQGQRVQLTAIPSQSAGQTLLVAQDVQIEGRRLPLVTTYREERFSSTSMPQQQQQQSWQTYSQSSSGGNQITGTVEQIDVRNLEGERHLVTLIQGDRGYQWIDLGPWEQVQHVRSMLQEGAQVQLQASPSQSSGQTIYVAQTVSVNGQSIPLSGGSGQNFATNEQSWQQQSWSQQQSRQSQSQQGGQQMQGTIQSLTTTTIQGERYLVARVNTDQGVQQISLGPVSQASQLRSQLQEGQQISFSGRPQQIEGQTIYITQNVKVDGRTIQTGGVQGGQQSWDNQQNWDRNRDMDRDWDRNRNLGQNQDRDWDRNTMNQDRSWERNPSPGGDRNWDRDFDRGSNQSLDYNRDMDRPRPSDDDSVYSPSQRDQSPPYGRAHGYRANRGMEQQTGAPGRRMGQQNREQDYRTRSEMERERERRQRQSNPEDEDR
jgi:hypothetical protein